VDLLLDAHVLLWWDQSDTRLSLQVRTAIADAGNRVYVSAASPWEIAIKARKGKLRYTGSPAALIEANGFLPLPISPVHAEAAERLHGLIATRSIACWSSKRSASSSYSCMRIRSSGRSMVSRSCGRSMASDRWLVCV
jgi:PIN domain nuclease of toxin-antitoxin system